MDVIGMFSALVLTYPLAQEYFMFKEDQVLQAHLVDEEQRRELEWHLHSLPLWLFFFLMSLASQSHF